MFTCDRDVEHVFVVSPVEGRLTGVDSHVVQWDVWDPEVGCRPGRVQQLLPVIALVYGGAVLFTGYIAAPVFQINFP